MARSARQLDAEISAELKIQRVDVKKLFAWRPKVEATITDVAEGRTSRSNEHPIKVSRLDSPRGAFWIIDGHHRAVEAVLRRESTVRVVVDDMLPRIERTGGAYSSVLADRVNVANFVKSRT